MPSRLPGVSIVVLSLLALASPAVATASLRHDPLGSVGGTVRDATTGLPLAAATVRLLELERRVDTHADGRFLIPSVPAGQYTLLVQRIGYRPHREVVRVGDESHTDVTVRLAASPLELPGIVVTGTLRAQEHGNAIQPTSVVGGQRLDRTLAGTLAETLLKEPGVAAVSMGPATSRPIIRGLGGDRVLLLEDGARTGDMSYSSPDHAVTSDPGGVERIEVVRGPAALLYGSNALSGVVNVIREEIPTTRPDGVHGRFTVQGQSASSGGFAGGHLTAPLGGLALRLEASARGAGDMRTPVGRLDNTQLTTWVAGGAAGVVRDWGHAGVSYRYFNSTYGIPGGFIGGHDEGVTVEMRRNAFRGEIHGKVGGFIRDAELSAGFTHYAHEEIEAGGLLGTAFRLVTMEATALAHHDAFGPAHRGGFGARAQFRDFAFGGSLGTPDAREWSTAAFVLEEFETGRLRLQAGGRYDLTRIEPLEQRGGIDIGEVRPRTFGALTGSVGGLVDLGGGVGVGLNLGRAFRSPDVNDLYSRGPHLAAFREEVGNPDLKLEHGLGVDAFVRLTLPSLRAEIAAFQNRIRQFIYPRETGDTSQRNLPIAQFVGENATLVGGEARLTWTPLRHLVLDAGASYVRGTLTDSDEPLPLIPPLRGSADLRFERPSWFAGIGTRLAARQDRLGEFEEPTDGYALLDAVAGYRWEWFGRLHGVTVRLDNLTDATWRDHLSRVKSIMPGPSRSISLLYRADF
jgi:iron complex outermembrane receptor protein